MDILTLKRNALHKRHTLQHYFAIYDLFQKYVEVLKPYVSGAKADVALADTLERFRLAYVEYESRFLEWHDGYQVVNAGIAAFFDPDNFRNNKAQFEMMLLLATAKFEDILKKAGRDLAEMHEEIALVEGETQAAEVTHVPSSALGKIKEADAVAEIGSKWLGRIVKFAPWAYEVIKSLHS